MQSGSALTLKQCLKLSRVKICFDFKAHVKKAIKKFFFYFLNFFLE